MQRTFHVYFMASQSGVLYLGVTGHLSKRVYQRQQKLIPGFATKYNCTKLSCHPEAAFCVAEGSLWRFPSARKEDLLRLHYGE